jgi:hypothetical protein
MDKIKVDYRIRNTIYSNLLIQFRNCFIEQESKEVVINRSVFFEAFFMFLHNPVNHILIENLEDGDMHHSFRLHMIRELEAKFPKNDTNNLIANKLQENFYTFVNFLVKRKLCIEDIAKKLWMLCGDGVDDVSMWIRSESMIENDLILTINPAVNKRAKYGINLDCLVHDQETDTFPKVLFKRI